MRWRGGWAGDVMKEKQIETKPRGLSWLEHVLGVYNNSHATMLVLLPCKRDGRGCYVGLPGSPRAIVCYHLRRGANPGAFPIDCDRSLPLRLARSGSLTIWASAATKCVPRTTRNGLSTCVSITDCRACNIHVLAGARVNEATSASDHHQLTLPRALINAVLERACVRAAWNQSSGDQHLHQTGQQSAMKLVPAASLRSDCYGCSAQLR